MKEVLINLPDALAKALSGRTIANSLIRELTCSASEESRQRGELPTLTGLRIVDCELVGPIELDGLHLDSVSIESKREPAVNSRIGLMNSFLTRCTLRGFLPAITTGDYGDSQILGRQALRRRHYLDVDWALDVSDCESFDVVLAGLPPSKIRFDPKYATVLVRSNYDDFLLASKADPALILFRSAVSRAATIRTESVLVCAPDKSPESAMTIERIARLWPNG